MSDIELTNAITRIKESADIFYQVVNADEDYSVNVENGTLVSLLALQKRVTDQTDIVNQTLDDTIASLSFRGEWQASTSYNVEEFVRFGAIMYMALESHTSHSSDFNVDLTAGKWIIYAPTDASFMKYNGISLPNIFQKSFYITPSIAAAKLVNPSNFKYMFIKETGGFYEWDVVSEKTNDNNKVITPTAYVGSAGRFLLLTLLSEHNSLTDRNASNAHPSSSISHGVTTAKALLDDYSAHRIKQSTVHGSTSEPSATKIVQRDNSGQTKIKSPDYTDSGVNENFAVNVKTARNIKSVIDTHTNKTTATSANPIHGSTSTATANKLMHRDASGRAEVSDPDLSKNNQIVNVKTFKTTKDIVDSHVDTDSTDDPHGATPDLVNEALIRRDINGTAKFGLPTENEHPIRKIDIESLPQLLGIARFDGNGNSLTYKGNYNYGTSYSNGDTVYDPVTDAYYVCIDPFTTYNQFKDSLVRTNPDEVTTFPFNRHIGNGEGDTVNGGETVDAHTAGATWSLQDTYAGTTWSNKYQDSRHTYVNTESVRVVINEGQTAANGYAGDNVELDISDQEGVLWEISEGTGVDNEGEFVILSDLRTYYESTLSISPASPPIAHVNIYVGIKIPVPSFEILNTDDILVRVKLNNGKTVNLPNTMYDINEIDNSINILPDQIHNSILANFLQGTNVTQGTYATQIEVEEVEVIQRTFKTGTIADTFWNSTPNPTGLFLKAQNNISVTRLDWGEYALTIGSDPSLSDYMVDVFLPYENHFRADRKYDYGSVLDYDYGDDNQVRIWTYRDGDTRDINNIQVSVYK